MLEGFYMVAGILCLAAAGAVIAYLVLLAKEFEH